MSLFLGIDAGTTSIKAGLFRSNGQAVAISREEYSLDTPVPDWVELDPRVYWEACIRAVRAVLVQSGIEPSEIVALSVSSQGETVISVDGAGVPLRPAIVWLDNRATEEAKILSRQFAAQAYAITGLNDITPTWSACKILWLNKHQPDVFAATQKFLLVQDYLVYHLTNQFVTEGSVSSSTLLFNIGQDCWWEDMLEALEIDPAVLPEISKAGRVVGSLTGQAAETLGLKQKTVVVLGGMDQCVGAIGSGNIHLGIVSETTGAALALQVSIPEFNLDPSSQIPVYQHSVPGLFLACPFCPTAGMAFKWFRDVFCENEVASALQNHLDTYDVLTALAERVPPGSDGLFMLPHLSGSLNPVYNPEARGVFSGFTLGHHKGHFVRSILEAVAFILRRNLELFLASGIKAQQIRSSGGGARSTFWNQIKADVCGLPVISLASEEAALLGNAMLASVAWKEFASLEEASKQMVKLKSRTDPGPNQSVYEKFYQRYCELDKTMDNFFR